MQRTVIGVTGRPIEVPPSYEVITLYRTTIALTADYDVRYLQPFGVRELNAHVKDGIDVRVDISQSRRASITVTCDSLDSLHTFVAKVEEVTARLYAEDRVASGTLTLPASVGDILRGKKLDITKLETAHTCYLDIRRTRGKENKYVLLVYSKVKGGGTQALEHVRDAIEAMYTSKPKPKPKTTTGGRIEVVVSK